MAKQGPCIEDQSTEELSGEQLHRLSEVEEVERHLALGANTLLVPPAIVCIFLLLPHLCRTLKGKTRRKTTREANLVS